MKKRYKFLFIISGVFFVLGLYKALFYSFDMNYYVGGDAYNLIINAGKATAYFVLSMGTLITGTLFWIFDTIVSEDYYLDGKTYHGVDELIKKIATDQVTTDAIVKILNESNTTISEKED